MAAGGAAAATTLGPRELNRALIERQLLGRRHRRSAADAIAHLIGLQAQAPSPPYFGLWTRLAGFRAGELAGLLSTRKVVRIALMRGTLHLVTADDCLALRPLVQPVLDRDLRGAGRLAGAVTGLAPAAVAAAGRAALDPAALTSGELGARLARRWPGRDPAGLAYAARAVLPLVQVPPRGVWRARGPARYATAEAWLRRPLSGDPSPDGLVRRYLGAYGPASVADVQAWSGLTRLSAALERLRPELRTFRDEHGTELFDLPDAPRPDPGTPVPVRFLPEFDTVLLAHAVRSRVIAGDRLRQVLTRNGIVRPTFLVDGFVRGMWRIATARATATLVLEPFGPLARTDKDALAAEGGRLLDFATDGAGAHGIRFESPH